MRKEYLFQVICSILVFLYAYTFTIKMFDFKVFSIQIQAFPYLKIFGISLPYMILVAQAVISIMLIFPAYRKIGLYGSLVLLVSFTVYLILMISLKSGKLPCSCGGVIKTFSWKEHILFNIVFIAINLVGIKIRKAILRENVSKKKYPTIDNRMFYKP